MAQVENLKDLAQEIYDQGLEKAEKESKLMIETAKREAEQIIQRAKEEAARELAVAQKEAERFKESSLNELKVKSKQAIGELKQEIEKELINAKLPTITQKAFKDEIFIKDLILKTTEEWNRQGQIEVQVPAELKAKLELMIGQHTEANLEGMVLNTNDRIEQGFTIVKGDEGFFISFTPEDFEAFLKPYFSQHIQALLFKKG